MFHRVEAGALQKSQPGRFPSLEAHQATESGAVRSRNFSGAQAELLQDWPRRAILLILKVKAPCPSKTGAGKGYPCLTGYAKASCRELRPLRPVGGHVRAFLPRAGCPNLP